MASRVADRRPAARRPAQRKQVPRRGHDPYRGVIFGPAVVAGPAAWSSLGEPLRGAGLLTLLILSLLLVPVLMLGLVTAPGTLLHAMVPKDWRRRWRKHKKHPGPPGVLLQRMVRAADRNRCVHCGATAAAVKAQAVIKAQAAGRRTLSQSSLQLDHYFPWVLGGLMNFWNFFLLCPACNTAKSSYWKYRESGNEVYSRHADPRNIVRARAILASENRARWSLLRCWRAAWAF